ncbi:amino acid ABC transporter permease, partial [Rhizobium ruizarguesonis]
MTFDTNVIFSNLPEILNGAWVTILIWIVTT